MMRLIVLIFFVLLWGGSASAQTPVYPCDPANPTACASVAPDTLLRVANIATKIFYDAFETTFDTTSNWNAAVSSGGGVGEAWTAGQITLGTGTTANGYASVSTQHAFQPVPPGHLEVVKAIKIPAAIPANTEAFWGIGTAAGTPTAAIPVTEGCGFEIQAAATSALEKMYAVCFASSVRTVIQDLSVATGNKTQPTDGGTHTYFVFFRGDYYYFCIDSLSNVVAIQKTGVNGPNVNTQPVLIEAVAGTVAPLSSLTLTVAAVWVGDTARNGINICDATNPWRCQAVTAGGSATEVPADAVNFNNTTLSHGTVVNGLFSSGALVNPTTSQVVLGPIDMTGAQSVEFTQAYTSGSGVTLQLQESASASGPWSGVLGISNGGLGANSNTTNFPNAANGSFKANPSGKFIQVIAAVGGTETLSISGYLRAGPISTQLANPGVYLLTSSSSALGITSVVSASAEGSHVLKASAGNLYSVYATNLTGTAGFLLLLNSTTVPGDGAATPVECVPLPANGNASINYNPGPASVLSTGITVVLTSAATCFTQTTGTITGFIRGSVQ